MVLASLNKHDDVRFKTLKLKLSKGFLYVDVPENRSMNIIKGASTHGTEYLISYPDSSLLYYSNDRYSVTPNGINYQLNDSLLPAWWRQNDTVVSGRQSNGKFWKEIYRHGEWVGYKDITSKQIQLFDSSLNTFRRKK